MNSQAYHLHIRSIVLIDPHPVVCTGWEAIIRRCRTLTVCASASTRKDAFHLTRTESPDLVIMDPTLEDMDGLELIHHFTHHLPHSPILVVSAIELRDYLARLRVAGTHGFLPKTSSPRQLLAAIRSILSGRRAFPRPSPPATGTKATCPSLENLSDREIELFRFIGKGYTTQKIAEVMQLSEPTLHVYRIQIKKKLGLKDLALLTQQAILWEGQQH
ncbi:MAG: response regulator transcription factor [Kiritimatiellae bacterium]|nr:response regulator transcription factor [Kiritimatiellia bacterium]